MPAPSTTGADARSLPRTASARCAPPDGALRSEGSWPPSQGDPPCERTRLAARSAHWAPRSFNLTTGRTCRRVKRVGGGDIITYKITDLVVTPHGSIAIIRPEFNTEDGCETSYTEVIKADAGGQKVLDEQPCSVEDANDEPMPNPDAIRPHSL